jgi:hypothetical protein
MPERDSNYPTRDTNDPPDSGADNAASKGQEATDGGRGKTPETRVGSGPPPEELEALTVPTATGTPPRQVGRYSVFGEIGRGGMGAVLRGRDPELGRDLALKVMLGDHAARPEAVQRFREEAQVGGQLQHPGVVPVYELGCSNSGRPYFTMKLVKGVTLAQLLKERASPAQDRPRFLKVFEQVCQTVAYAHSKRVLHRDLKPANIMVGAFGEVQVMDWGLAKVLAKRESEASPCASPAGTPAPSTISSAVKVPETDKGGAGTQEGDVLGSRPTCRRSRPSARSIGWTNGVTCSASVPSFVRYSRASRPMWARTGSRCCGKHGGPTRERPWSDWIIVGPTRSWSP